MYGNLYFLMKKETVTQQQIADLLKVRPATVSDKMRGESDFYFEEAMKIKKEFFSGYELEFIFEKTDVQFENA